MARAGVANIPKRGEGMLGGQAVLAVGYDDASRVSCCEIWNTDRSMTANFTIRCDYLINSDLSADFCVIKQLK